MKLKLSATGPKPRSAQSHSVGATRIHVGARPTATRGAARARGVGAARVRSPLGLGRPAQPELQDAGVHLGLCRGLRGAHLQPAPLPAQPYEEIFTVNIDGSGIRRLTHNSFVAGTPAQGRR
jgi:hypothetical protein